MYSIYMLRLCCFNQCVTLFTALHVIFLKYDTIYVCIYYCIISYIVVCLPCCCIIPFHFITFISNMSNCTMLGVSLALIPHYQAPLYTICIPYIQYCIQFLTYFNLLQTLFPTYLPFYLLFSICIKVSFGFVSNFLHFYSFTCSIDLYGLFPLVLL